MCTREKKDGICFRRNGVWDLCLTLVTATLGKYTVYVPIHGFDVCDVIYNLCVIDLHPVKTSDSIIHTHAHSLHHNCDHGLPTELKFIMFLSVSYLLHVFASLHYLCVCLHRSIWAYIMRMLPCCQSRCKRPSASLLHEFTDSRPAEKCLCVCDRVNTGANSGEMDEQRDEWRHGKEILILLWHSYGTDYIHSPE